MLSEDERDRLGRICREAWADYWRRDKPTYMESWEQMASQDKEGYRCAAAAVAAAVSSADEAQRPKAKRGGR